MRTIQEYRVFIASPGKLEDIRKAFREELVEFNQASALRRGFLFTAVGWEDTLGGAQRAQSLINKELVKCDALLLVLWDRWGSPPDKDGTYSSGSEEEWSLGLECLRDPKCDMRTVAAIFKAVEPEKMETPDPQLQLVLNFRKELEASKEHLYMSFGAEMEFRRLLRRYLSSWLHEVDTGVEVKPEVPAFETAVSGDKVLDGAILEGAVLGGTVLGGPVLSRSPMATRSAKTLGPNRDLDRAQSLADAGQLTDAETLYARAIASGTDPDAFNRYGHFLMRLGRLEQARVMFQRVLELAPVAGEEWKAKALGNLGLIYQGQDKPEEARASLEEALALFEHQGDLSRAATARTNLGNLALNQEHLDEAEALFRQALDVFKMDPECEEEVPVLYGKLGAVFLSRGEHERAEVALRQALEIHRHLKSPAWIANDSANLGLALQARGKHTEAKEAWNRARDLYTQVGSIEQAQEVEDLLATLEAEAKAHP